MNEIHLSAMVAPLINAAAPGALPVSFMAWWDQPATSP